MKKWFGRIIPMTSVALLLALGYYANSVGLVAEFTSELQRYSAISSQQLLVIVAVIGGSFIFGYLSSRVGRRKSVQV